MSASGPVSAEMVLAATSIIDGVSTPDTPDEALATKAVIEGDRATSFAVTIDELTVARARKGNLAALETLFHTFEIPVFNLARRLCRSSHDARMVLQETFLEVVRSVGRVSRRGLVAGWVRRITVTKALMKLRSLRAREPRTSSTKSWRWKALLGRVVSLRRWRASTSKSCSAAARQRRVVLWLHEVEATTTMRLPP